MHPHSIKEEKPIGYVDSTKTYTKLGLAAAMGRTERWISQLLNDGLPHYSRGPGFISGRTFQQFVEEKSEVRKRVPTPGDS